MNERQQASKMSSSITPSSATEAATTETSSSPSASGTAAAAAAAAEVTEEQQHSLSAEKKEKNSSSPNCTAEIPIHLDGGPNCLVKKKTEDKIEIMVSSVDNVAISFDDSFKHYGRGRRKVPVLVGLNMTIPKGAIYGLLGPSGCGKTTLLSCIVGKQRLQGGSITVFGGSPGSDKSGE